MFPKNGQVKINHVITNMTVNHDPNGVVSLHTNGALFKQFTYISRKEFVKVEMLLMTDMNKIFN